MTGRFDGRVCLVTGSTGMAAACATALAAEDASVVVASRTTGHVDALVRDILAAGHRAVGVTVDLVDPEGPERAVSAAVDAFGRLDCVFNVAGISGRRYGDGPAHECTSDGWDAVLDTNARAMFLGCGAAIRQMLGQEPDASGRRGVLLNMSSVLATHPSSRFFATHAYAASKGAIEGFSRAMAAYYAPDGIRVNVIAPSLVATPMSRRAQGDPEIVAYLESKQPLARGPLATEDVVGTVLYLLGPESAMVTGQVVAVDGGWSVSEGR